MYLYTCEKNILIYYHNLGVIILCGIIIKSNCRGSFDTRNTCPAVHTASSDVGIELPAICNNTNHQVKLPLHFGIMVPIQVALPFIILATLHYLRLKSFIISHQFIFKIFMVRLTFKTHHFIATTFKRKST